MHNYESQRTSRDHALRGSQSPAARHKSAEPANLPQKAEPLERGTVKWFDSQKGFGILLNEGGKEVWFHINSVEDADSGFPIPGDRVFFKSNPARRQKAGSINRQNTVGFRGHSGLQGTGFGPQLWVHPTLAVTKGRFAEDR
jgi:cold shock CspA family protein